MKYKLMKRVEGNWYEWGVYSTLEGLAKAAFFLGQSDGIDEVKVEVVTE
jgi:hypothetical protein